MRRALPCLVLVTVTLAAACGGGQPAPEPPVSAVPPGDAASCGDYEAHPATWQYCVYDHIRTVETAERAGELCARTGMWEAACRETWVVDRLPASYGVATDTLLGVCGEHEDCTFQVLDSRPLDDVLEQVRQCQRHAPSFAFDCKGHALERWYDSAPDGDEIALVIAADTGLPERVGYFVGLSEACRGVGSCAMLTAGRPECLAVVEDIRSRKIHCPGPGGGGTRP